MTSPAPGEPASADAEADPEADPEAETPTSAAPAAIVGPWRRALHVVWALSLGVLIVGPNLPTSVFGPLPSRLTGTLRPLSFAQSWRMYAPNPQRSQTYMNLVAHYPGGRTVDLEETLQERDGWGATWAGDKSRVDMWRHYANFHPKRANDHRRWYLRAVCIREARKGEVPTKIIMEQVRRRFTPPKKVRKGKPALGRKKRRTISMMPCKTRAMTKLIEADRERRGQPPQQESR